MVAGAADSAVVDGGVVCRDGAGQSERERLAGVVCDDSDTHRHEQAWFIGGGCRVWAAVTGLWLRFAPGGGGGSLVHDARARCRTTR